MEKKKLLVTASTFPRWENDTEPRFILDLSKHMTDEFDVTVLVPAAPGAKDKEILEGVNVVRYHYFPVHKWETLCYPGAIVPRIREKKIRILLVPFLLLSLYGHLLKMVSQYDIVHAHWLIPQGIVQSFFKKPYIVTGHGGDVTSLNEGILKKLKTRCIRKAKAVTVVSQYLKGRVQELVPEKKVAVISMGVDVSRFGKRYYVPNYFGQGDKKVVLFVGRLAEKKGVTYLIEAMKEIDAICVIVGNGPLRDMLIEQAKGQGEKIKFLGAKSHDELKTIYASADVFVAPSITAKDGDMEGLPTTIMEAMASNLPIIASDSGGICELIKHNYNGLLFEEKDVSKLREYILIMLNRENWKCDLMYGMKKTVEKWDYISISKQYRELLCET